jgi:Cu+-exporting ATPase
MNASPPVRLAISGMHCAGCVGTVERALAAVPGVAAAQVNLATETATVQGTAAAKALIDAVTQAGYAAHLPEAAAPPEQGRREDFLALACVLLAAPFLAEMAAHLSGAHGLLPGGLQAGLALGVAALALPRMLKGAWRALLARSGNMDQLVVLGTLAALGLSFWHLATGGILYFEAAAFVPALVLLGKRLEARARLRAGGALAALAKLRPATATRLAPDGTEATVPAPMLEPGQVFRARAGEIFAADGVVTEGASAADESLVTGESLPVPKRVGDRVIAGTLNAEGALLVRVTAAGPATAVARIIDAVSQAMAAKAPMQALADRVAGLFVPAVIGLAALTFLFWWFSGAGHEAALVAAITVLVVSCPCALGLATPVAIVAGLGSAARQGVLFRDAAATESARRLDVIVLDKTGTLTEGRPALVATTGAEDTLALAAALSKGASHPVSRGILAAHKTPPRALAVRQHPGAGVEGRVAGRRLRLGTQALLDGIDLAAFDGFVAEHEAQGASVVFLADDAAAIGALALADPVRPEAEAALAELRALGLSPVLATGDNAAAARAIAGPLGITEIHARQSPAAKASLVRGLQAAGKRVAVLGDGVNDAPAFAVADLSLAMGGGADAAVATAAIGLLRDDPRLAASAIRIGRATAAKVRQNLALAFGYNLVAIPLAMAGALSPSVAGAAMAASSMLVVLNALLLRGAR